MWQRTSILTVLFSVAAISAQNSVQLRVDVQVTPVDVYVEDAAGRTITNLAQKDFTVLEDGQPREIRSFESAESPYNILLLFDRSSSTEEQWPYLVKALSLFISQLPDQHRIALAAFDDRREMLVNWTSAREFARQALVIRSENAGTQVYEALEWAVSELRKISGRKGVIVFTDGVDNRLSKKLVSFDKDGVPSIAPMNEDNDFQKTLRTLRQARIPIYFVAPNTDQNPDPRIPYNSFDQKQRTAARLRMEAFAERTNGVLHLPKQIEDVGALYGRIGKQLGYSYTLSFTPAHLAIDGSFHRIEVRAGDRSLRVIQSREGYYAR
jgi:VWFA-related protein